MIVTRGHTATISESRKVRRLELAKRGAAYTLEIETASANPTLVTSSSAHAPQPGASLVMARRITIISASAATMEQAASEAAPAANMDYQRIAALDDEWLLLLS